MATEFFVLCAVVVLVATFGIAWLASSMGRDPFVWGLYALLIWPLALVHLLVLGEPKPSTPAVVINPPASAADEIAKLAALHSQGVLTDDEFSAAKARLIQ